MSIYSDAVKVGDKTALVTVGGKTHEIIMQMTHVAASGAKANATAGVLEPSNSVATTTATAASSTVSVPKSSALADNNDSAAGKVVIGDNWLAATVAFVAMLVA